MDAYLQQGINQAAQARDMVSYNWSDVWKNYGIQYALAHQEFDLNQQAAENEYQRNLQMWNLQNEYNSPAAQMQRFAQAGLNPNLIYTQGSSGNASSPVQYHAAQYRRPDVKINPTEVTAQKVAMASQITNMIANAAGNVANVINHGMDIKLKSNEVAESDFDKNLRERLFSRTGGGVNQISLHNLGDKLNPLSDSFDPMAFIYFQKNGQLPVFWNNYLSADIGRSLTSYRADFQKYYNENLLPKLNEYNKGKINAQDMQNEMTEYYKDSLEMVPPELRGILQPLFEYLGPLFKFMFKNLNVTHQ